MSHQIFSNEDGRTSWEQSMRLITLRIKIIVNDTNYYELISQFSALKFIFGKLRHNIDSESQRANGRMMLQSINSK